MMGSGKSTIGPLLAERLSLPWIDLDEAVERRALRSIREIWSSGGEEEFRELEAEALAALGPFESVVGCGGGIVTRERSRRLLSDRGRCVYLKASPSVLASRLWESDSGLPGGRPLLEGVATPSELEARLARILSEREDHYESCAELVVETDRCTPREAVEFIAEWWTER